MKEKNAIFLATEKKKWKNLGMKKKMCLYERKKKSPAYYHHVPTLILAKVKGTCCA